MLELAQCNFNSMNWVALTDGATKYIRHINHAEHGGPVEQLFNLTTDPYEQHDLAKLKVQVPAVAAWRAQLAQELAREKRGPSWIASDGSLAAPHSCEEYEELTSEPQVERRPNIVFFLSDDQDLMLGGSDAPPMRATTTLIAERGATAVNFFAHVRTRKTNRFDA
jgi:arylsulfatase A-like enzyme